jgi:hypothetical protein
VLTMGVGFEDKYRFLASYSDWHHSKMNMGWKNSETLMVFQELLFKWMWHYWRMQKLYMILDCSVLIMYQVVLTPGTYFFWTAYNSSLGKCIVAIRSNGTVTNKTGYQRLCPR